MVQFSKGRKPNGEGRLSLQKKWRKENAAKLAALIVPLLDHDVVEQTGSLFPRRLDLRKPRCRALVCLKSFTGRFYTQKLCAQVVKNILRALDFTVTKDPRMSWDEYVLAQARRLQKLAKKSKRVHKKKSRQKKMDNVETQPLETRFNYL